jgi:hypothetical protein
MFSSHIYEKILLELNNDVEFTKMQQIHYYPNSNKIAVILDPRFNSLMEAVIRNFMYFMNPLEWNLCIISYSGYENQIKSIFPNCIFMPIDEKYIYMKNNVPNITLKSYNEIFLSTAFWKNIPGEHILIFQTDCIMFKMFPDYFLYYDYCGANYYNQGSILYGGINGGCSLRKKSTMIECIEKINWNTHVVEYKINITKSLKYPDKTICIQHGNSKYLYPIMNIHITSTNEDVFFTHACEILIKNVPDIIHRSFFSIEVDANLNTCIFHGWNKNYHSNTFTIQILQQSTLFKKYIDMFINNAIVIKNTIPKKIVAEINKSIPLLDNISYINIAD